MTNTAQAGDEPLYGASIGQAYSRFWQRYVLFYGRASRSEFWWVLLINAVIGVVLSSLSRIPHGGGVAFATLSYLYSLATILPSLALGVRRLHDGNRSGFWLFIGLIPVVGAIILLVFFASPTNPNGARFDRANAGRAYQGTYPEPPYPTAPYPAADQAGSYPAAGAAGSPLPMPPGPPVPSVGATDPLPPVPDEPQSPNPPEPPNEPQPPEPPVPPRL